MAAHRCSLFILLGERFLPNGELVGLTKSLGTYWSLKKSGHGLNNLHFALVGRLRVVSRVSSASDIV